MSKTASKAKSIKEQDRVKLTDGEHAGKLGKVKHIRAATGEAHVELDQGGKVVNVQVSTLEAA